MPMSAAPAMQTSTQPIFNHVAAWANAWLPLAHAAATDNAGPVSCKCSTTLSTAERSKIVGSKNVLMPRRVSKSQCNCHSAPRPRIRPIRKLLPLGPQPGVLQSADAATNGELLGRRAIDRRWPDRIPADTAARQPVRRSGRDGSTRRSRSLAECRSCRPARLAEKSAKLFPSERVHSQAGDPDRVVAHAGTPAGTVQIDFDPQAIARIALPDAVLVVVEDVFQETESGLAIAWHWQAVCGCMAADESHRA